jgi:hypothetical protein
MESGAFVSYRVVVPSSVVYHCSLAVQTICCSSTTVPNAKRKYYGTPTTVVTACRGGGIPVQSRAYTRTSAHTVRCVQAVMDKDVGTGPS